MNSIQSIVVAIIIVLIIAAIVIGAAVWIMSLYDENAMLRQAIVDRDDEMERLIAGQNR